MLPIFEYSDYRAFLRAWMAERPQQRTQRAMARRSRTTSSFVSMLLAGKRNLDVERASAWGAAMGLDGDDLAHWCAMVRAAHGSDLERQEASVELRTRRAQKRASQLPSDFDAFDSWKTWAILELAKCPGFVADPDWVANQLRPKLGSEEAARILEWILTQNLIRVGDADVVGVIDVRRSFSAATEDPQPPKRAHHVEVVFSVPQDALDAVKGRLEMALMRAIEGLSDFGRPSQVVQVRLELLLRSAQSP